MSLKLKRPNETLRQLNLTDTLELRWLVSGEGPKPGDMLVLWLGNTAVRTADEGPEPRLKLSTGTTSEDEEEGSNAVTIDRTDLINTVAEALHGQVWDSEQSAWR